MSQPGSLTTNQDGLPACRQVLTGPAQSNLLTRHKRVTVIPRHQPPWAAHGST